MKNVVIIEDEKAVASSLVNLLRELVPDMQVKAVLETVKESVAFLSQATNTDLIFSDVQLTDGLSFSIFNKVAINSPIIFITGYDKFMLNAFEYNSIDYLLKPVCKEDLKKAIDKYNRLEQHFVYNTSLLNTFLQNFNQQKRKRIIVKKGLENISLLLDDVALFFTENKIVYVIDKNGRKYLADKNLSDQEEELDPKTFFRVNRQYIVNINYIRSFKAYERVKLQVELTVSDLNCFIVVSQETAPVFRKWIAEY
ncbi:MAG TPA: LytTR family DNA-binding domain-containing protein [Chitinophagaceae bacterium]|nr:LytTR family DNA-binding domain-containing protein [Chitinophagaceae bacterium]